APTPFVDDVRSSVDLGVADCGDESPIDLFVNPGGHGSSEITFTATPNATLSSNAIVLHAPRSALLPRVFETRDAPTGIRSTVERPPR
ncbi:MAG TPA: hypothetical protein VF407_12115, partial [Polyangiaceae bacterium]